MVPLAFPNGGAPRTVLCLGAHSDDIEIGAGGTILAWLAAGAALDVHWCVLTASGAREAEARAAAQAFTAGAASVSVECAGFRDGFLPYLGGTVKDWFEGLKKRVSPDIVLTHRSDDAHQDHREVCRLTTNAFRDSLVLEYEIPKWDGDIGRPNAYVALPEAVMARKVDLLQAHFASQRCKDWFDAETFRGLARLRGMECRAPERYAEGFVARKIRIG